MRRSIALLFALSVLLVPVAADAADCCTPKTTPGCPIPDVEDCVCAEDPYCCDTAWDETCVEEIDQYGCGFCGSGPICGDGFCDAPEDCEGCPDDCGPCPDDCGNGWCDIDEDCTSCPADCGPCGGGGDCCAPNGTPGCDDDGIESCVCAQDIWCCSNVWDQACVDEITEYGCGSCGGASCGDDWCDLEETCETCPADCGPCGGTGDCCAPNGTPGCETASIEDCVCAQDPWCCSNEWDQTCVEEVEDFGCGDCGGATCGDAWCDLGETCETCPADCGECAGCGDGDCSWDEDCTTCSEDCGPCSTGDCCEPQDGPGCGDQFIQDCVCLDDPWCCGNEWDQTCVDEVDAFGCGDCGGGGADCGDGDCDVDEDCEICPADCGPCLGCGDGWCDMVEDCESCPADCGPCGTGDCCAVGDAPGCGDIFVQDCVCSKDAWCCDNEWDQTCVDEVEGFGCGDCGGGGAECGDLICQPVEDCASCPQDCGACGGIGDCCEAQEGPGCGDSSLQACVCAQDSFCCEFVWDSVCVDEVNDFGCGDCTGTGPSCGDGACVAGEDCIFCPADCGECPGGDCCNPHGTAGCGDGGVQDCVCAEDAWCCDVEWDVTCVLEVVSFQCGTCEGGTVPVCGDGMCKAGETCETCPADCGPCGSTGACCEVHESTGCDKPMVQGCVCQQDAYCCQVAWDETCVAEVVDLGCGTCGTCVPDCNGKDCGGDGCGGSCGACPADESCQEGQCVGGCTPNCTNKFCGDDGCGGTCGDCPPGRECKDGDCVPACLPDCTGKQCGSDGCGGTCGSCPPGFFCEDGHCNDECTPSCTGKECGPDGCGGSCGQCPGGFFCQQGKCDIQCTPDCNGKQCGDDGCGGSCGSCPPEYSCDPHGHCKQGCTPSCSGKQCGDDGCGGSCGACPGGQTCNATGHCVEGCVPDCSGKQCGPDGCGGTCGACGFGYHCNMTGFQCEEDNACTPDCHGKQCGDDGCGGVCGTCPPGYLCGDTFKCAPDMPAGEDTTEPPEEDVQGPGPQGCPEGYSLLYGNCVPDADLDGGTSGGCAAGGTRSPAAGLPLVALLAMIALIRRRGRLLS
jgi:hypothetical protein